MAPFKFCAPIYTHRKPDMSFPHKLSLVKKFTFEILKDNAQLSNRILFSCEYDGCEILVHKLEVGIRCTGRFSFNWNAARDRIESSRYSNQTRAISSSRALLVITSRTCTAQTERIS